MTQTPIDLESARRQILQRVRTLPSVQVSLAEALGRRLAEDVVATAPVQPFNNSAMDGYALRAADTDQATARSPVAFRLRGEARAGRPARVALAAKETIEISTGAMLPVGADAVARIEHTTREADKILVRVRLARGADVRRAGEDFRLGDGVLAGGTVIGPAELGALASIGRDRVACVRRPRVAVVTNGDELTPPGEPLRPGAIWDANWFTIPASARLAGADVVSIARTPDDVRATRNAIGDALDADVTLVCGGVSVGRHDHVKDALDQLGVEQVFWKVALKPGGPIWFGQRDRTLVFGLPGNPVSAMVTFLLLARPALFSLAGGDPGASRALGILATKYRKPIGRTDAVRCRLEATDPGRRIHPLPRQGSHMLTSIIAADCLALMPDAAANLEAGESVEIELLDRPGVPPVGSGFDS
jgi:molybdopterin molybdotransferase